MRTSIVPIALCLAMSTLTGCATTDDDPASRLERAERLTDDEGLSAWLVEACESLDILLNEELAPSERASELIDLGVIESAAQIDWFLEGAELSTGLPRFPDPDLPTTATGSRLSLMNAVLNVCDENRSGVRRFQDVEGEPPAWSSLLADER